MADFLPKFSPGAAVTFVAQSDVVGGRLVVIAGDRAVAPAGAASQPVGVAATDAKAGEHVLVYLDGVMQLVSGGVVAAGALVGAGAAGVAVAGSGVGLALTGASAAGVSFEVAFRAGATAVA